ncbi:hypothetical protein JOL62DRAFT_170266 [Phyllosticta paracitricarpa]|uniref:Transmembrane protein n=1 Tax=Phyllosticta paracitricarpa TaxID=2016321 RepID=A0ABR1N2F7_9PEZI
MYARVAGRSRFSRFKESLHHERLVGESVSFLSTETKSRHLHTRYLFAILCVCLLVLGVAFSIRRFQVPLDPSPLNCPSAFLPVCPFTTVCPPLTPPTAALCSLALLCHTLPPTLPRYLTPSYLSRVPVSSQPNPPTRSLARTCPARPCFCLRSLGD